jgi:hypothetical protein
MPYICSITKNGIAVHEEGVDHHQQYVFYVDYDDVTNRVTLEIRDIAGNVVLSVVETAGDPTMTGKLVDMLMASIAALDWQESVLDRLAAPPMGPADGARYLATATAGGWTVDHIYEWDAGATAWVDTTPNEGMCVFVESENTFYRYAGAVWVTFFNITDLKASSVGLTASADPEILSKTGSVSPVSVSVQDMLNDLIVVAGSFQYTALDLLAAPPVPALDGDTYAVDVGAIGPWAGQDGNLAVAVFSMGAFDHWDFIIFSGGEMVVVGAVSSYVIVSDGAAGWYQFHAMIATPVPGTADEQETLAQKVGAPANLGAATLALIQYLNNIQSFTVLDWTDTPPMAPGDGDTYAVAAGAIGAWVGQDGTFARWDAGGPAWVFFNGEPGDIVYVNVGTPYLIQYTGGADFVNFGAVLLAAGIPLVDADNYFTTDNVEAALQQVGETLANIAALGTEIMSVILIANDDPVPANDGDTYAVGPAGIDGWLGHDNEIAVAVFSMGAFDHWDFIPMDDGHMVYREDYAQIYIKDYTTHAYIPASEFFVPVDAIYWQYDADGVLRWQTGMAEQVRNQGHIGKAIWTPVNNPSNGDTVTIGADTYEFDDGGGVGPGNIQVLIGVALTNTLDNLVTAIDVNGTQNVVGANTGGTALTLETAISPGGAVLCGVLPAVSGSVPADVWVVYATGKVVGGRHTIGEVGLTTANIAAAFDIDLDFTPTWCKFSVYDASGVPVALDSASMVVGASKVTFDPDNDCADTNVLVFEAGN